MKYALDLEIALQAIYKIILLRIDQYIISSSNLIIINGWIEWKYLAYRAYEATFACIWDIQVAVTNTHQKSVWPHILSILLKMGTSLY